MHISCVYQFILHEHRLNVKKAPAKTIECMIKDHLPRTVLVMHRHALYYSTTIYTQASCIHSTVALKIYASMCVHIHHGSMVHEEIRRNKLAQTIIIMPTMHFYFIRSGSA